MFGGLVESRWGTSINLPKKNDAENLGDKQFKEYEGEYDPKRTVPDIQDTVDDNGKLLNHQPVYNKILCSKVSLKIREIVTVGVVTNSDLGTRVTVAGTYDENRCLDTMIYEVEFPNGKLKQYAETFISKNMLNQVNSGIYSLSMMESITYYIKGDAISIPKINKCPTTTSGQKILKKTAVGWSLLVKWDDGSESRICLKCLKESHPINTVQFYKSRIIADDPAFEWWLPYMLRKRDIVISDIYSRIRNTTHKYGTEMLTSV